MQNRYPGGKNGSGVYQTIINYIPPHRHYIELFLGSGAIMRLKKRAETSFACELNAAVIAAGNWPDDIAISNCCALDWLKRERNQMKSWNTGNFIYCDPPYPFSVRKSQRPIYQYEMTDSQHRELLRLLLPLKCYVAISSYQNDLYDHILKDWNLVQFQAQTRTGPAVECLYMNYPVPTELHDYRYLGDDFIERQRIKRKIERHVNRLRELPALERAAILSALSSQF